jgi:hypothetical protein
MRVRALINQIDGMIGLLVSTDRRTLPFGPLNTARPVTPRRDPWWYMFVATAIA